MSRLDELIAKFCPNGVKYRELKDILIIKNGKDYKNLTEGKYPVYGSGGIMTYVSSYVYDKPSVLIPRKGSIDKLYYVEEPFWNVDTIFYTEIDEEKVIPRYVYFCLQKEHLEQYNTAGGVPSLTQKVLNRVKLPVPPLEVQREIVHILDSFTLLTAELTAELTARRKQYEFYRNKLLSQNKKYAMKPLSELGEWSGGKTPSTAERKFWEDGVIPWISSKDMKVSTLEDTQNHITQKAVKEASMKVYPPNSIAIVTRSGILKHTFPVAYVPFETTVNQDIKILVVNHEILPRYAFHVIQGKGKDILLKTCLNGSSEFMTNASSSIVNMLYNTQLMRLAGADGVAAYGVIMYANFIFAAIYLGYSMGSAPITSYNYGSGNHSELKNMLKKSLSLIAVTGVCLTLISEFFSHPLINIFVGYDADLFAMTLHGFRLYAFVFLINGVNIWASSFFTALNNGVVSGMIAFLRTLLFQIGCIMLLPLVLGLNGIWMGVVVAEMLTLIVTIYFLRSRRKVYHY